MVKEIIINAHPWETRAALLDNGVLSEFYLERPKDLGVSGNIYKGKVIRVMPGMEAAFVDIGLEKAAFLYATDFLDEIDEIESLLDKDSPDYFEGLDQPYSAPVAGTVEMMKRGQEVLVQVAREPIGSKGARITSHISLPGKYLVMLTMMDRVGVSRRIEDEAERKRLKQIVEQLKPPGTGFIVRTAGQGMSENEIREDLEFLMKLSRSILAKKERSGAPVLIHRELDLGLRMVRDLLTQDVDALIIDSETEYRRLLEFAESFLPHVAGSIRRYERLEPIFEQYGLEMEIKRALGKKVWLKSGGSIVIEGTEALTAVDVNTGKFVGKRNLEDTILRTNLEAVREIAYQLRLRNIGGLVIIDFIDMERAENREKVYKALEEAMKADTKKTNILKISELGIVEMTRKRTRENLTQALADPCPYCDGHGFLKSKRTVCYEIFRDLIKGAGAKGTRGEKATVQVNPDVASLLFDEERVWLDDIEERFGIRVAVRAAPQFHIEEYEIGWG
jgi:ribonuclease G